MGAILTSSLQYGEPAAPTTVDPYSDAYNAPPAAPTLNDRDDAAPRGRSRSRSPATRSNGDKSDFRSPTFRRRSPPPRRPAHAPVVSYHGPCFVWSMHTYEF